VAGAIRRNHPANKQSNFFLPHQLTYLMNTSNQKTVFGRHELCAHATACAPEGFAKAHLLARRAILPRADGATASAVCADPTRTPPLLRRSVRHMGGHQNLPPLFDAPIGAPSQITERKTAPPKHILATHAIQRQFAGAKAFFGIKLFFAFCLLFVLNITGAAAQSNTALPEPVIARNEAGQYQPKLEKIRLFLVKKQQREFVNAINDLESEIHWGRLERGGKRTEADPTKEEFAALEWLYYYYCSGRLTKPKEIWEWILCERTYFDKALRIFTEIVAASERGVKVFSLDDGRFRKTRMAWAAVLLRKLEVWFSEFEEEKIAIKSRARYYEFMTKYHKRYAATLLGDMTEETKKRLSKELRSYNRIAIIMGLNLALLESRVPWFEESFFKHLLRCFSDDLQSIDTYLKMGGFNTESERAMLFSNTKEGLMGSSWTAGIFGRYISWKQLNLNRLEIIAKSERKAKNEKLKRLEHKWKVIAEKLEVEYDKTM
jgi:hypothetical protein